MDISGETQPASHCIMGETVLSVQSRDSVCVYLKTVLSVQSRDSVCVYLKESRDSVCVYLKESTVFMARLTLWRRPSRWVGPAAGRTDVIGRI